MGRDWCLCPDGKWREETKMAAKKKQEKQKEEDVKVENFRRHLAVVLTDDEVADRAQRSAQLLKERDHRELEFKEQAKANKQVIARMDGDLRELAAEVRERKTYQDVNCERRFNWTKGTVIEIRTDTGEQIDSRPMTEAEAQKALPLDEEAGDVDDEFDDEEDDAAE
jgi:hypothetical protein